MSRKRLAAATIALFSGSEHTHCALVVCDCEGVTAALHSAFLNLHRCFCIVTTEPLSTLCVSFFFLFFSYTFLLLITFPSRCTLCLFSARSRRVGALQISIIIIELPRCLVVTWLVPRKTPSSRRTFCVQHIVS